MHIGFIGLGNMGLPMSRRLAAAGHHVHVHDVDETAVAALEAEGAIPEASARAVGDAAETVFVSLPTPDVVASVAVGDGGVADGGAVRRIVDLSTTGTSTTRRLAADLAPRGIAWVDAPVSGGVSGASGGTLAIMASGPRDEFEAVEELLHALGRVFFVGGAPGLGQTMKLLNNALSATSLAATSEALAFGAKAGLDPAVMVDVLNVSSGRSSASEDKFPRAVLPGTFDFGFATGLMCKDLRLFGTEAETLGVPLWIGSVVRQVWQRTADQFGVGGDFTDVARTFEQWADVELRSLDTATT